MNHTKQLTLDILKSHDPFEGGVNQSLSRQQGQSLKDLVDKKIATLTDSQKKRVRDEFFGWGPIEALTDRDDLFDILINGPQHIFYEDDEGIKTLDDHFFSPVTFRNFIETLVKSCNSVPNTVHPFTNGKARGFRIHISTQPVSNQTTVSLRKSRNKTLTLQHLEESGFLSLNQKKWLIESIEKKENLLIAGPTGSGKTTFLNSLLSETPAKERCVIIEDTDEISAHSPLSCKLLTRDSPAPSLPVITMQELLKQALRMRPDRIIVGEIRGDEAKDLLQSLSTGHKGSMGTLHAESARQTLFRLEMLIQQGAPQWNLNSIRQLIQLGVDAIIVLKGDRLNKGIKEISRVSSHESFGLLLDPVKLND